MVSGELVCTAGWDIIGMFVGFAGILGKSCCLKIVNLFC